MYYQYQNINLYYEKHGNKKQTILILPGWGNTRNTFYPLINYLKEYFTIYIIDYPGFGNTIYPNIDLTIYDYSNLIYNFIKYLDIDNLIIIAHSFGGRITSLLTNTDINIKKILLMDVAGIKSFNLKLIIKTYLYKILKKIILPKRIKKRYLNYLYNVFSSNDYKDLNSNMYITFKNIINEDLKKYYKNIRIETLIIWGENDNITPISIGIKLNKLIKDSYLIPIKNTNHFPYIEKQYYVNKIIFEYLKKDIIF